MISTRKRSAIANMASGFEQDKSEDTRQSEAETEKLRSKIGRLVVDRGFWPLPRTGCLGREAKMVSADHKLSQRRQCALLRLTRSSLYCQPVGESAENLKFVAIIDKQFLETPWYGSRKTARLMKRQGHQCGRHRSRNTPAGNLAGKDVDRQIRGCFLQNLIGRP